MEGEREGRGHPLCRVCCGTTVQVINTLSVNFMGGWAVLLRRACGALKVWQGDASCRVFTRVLPRCPLAFFTTTG